MSHRVMQIDGTNMLVTHLLRSRHVGAITLSEHLWTEVSVDMKGPNEGPLNHRPLLLVLQR